ncbi:MAG TPA: hypothetical protein VGH28_30930 [Polyangiaceae bacterium]|jgi:hypothetical protein
MLQEQVMVEKFMKVIVAAGIAGGVLAAGCLTRPVVSENPTTKTSFQAEVKQQSIDKVDLLFAIDNSASMGDKQDLLALAVPILVGRLLNPNCVSTDTTLTCKAAGDCTGALGANAQCDTTGNNGAGQCFVAGDSGGGDNQCKSIAGTKAEFAPVHDMHVGIVSSSLGAGGGDVCAVSGSDPTHLDDQGHLLNRTFNGTTEGTVANAKPADGNGGNFLAWLPTNDPKNAGKTPPNVTPYTDSTQLVTDFTSLIKGVQQAGCGLEAQLESWYRFLVQPDPYGSIQGGVASGNSSVTYQDVDSTLLKQRHDFLRPDSLVAIIQLTDEEDSWSDPRWGSGFGFATRANTFPGAPPGLANTGVGPRETSACDAPFDPNNPTTWGPNSAQCTSCAFQGTSGDANCQSCPPGAATCPAKGWYVPASTTAPITAVDGLNVRYGEQYMLQRYGLDPQYDIQRYVDGLRSTQVPDRDHEDDNGASSSVGHYAPIKNCVNPLFADSLPDGSDTSAGALCTGLKLGSRTPDLVFYAIIGGVPNSLIDDGNGNLKLDLTSGDWEKILGHDPAHYDTTNIDPHMIESLAPRPGLTGPGATYNLGNDPDNGREWNTLSSNAQTDLQFACTFDLPAPRPCGTGASSCDCLGNAVTDPGGPPLCDVANRTSQIKGKAYPTIRELRVAKGLGQQAVVASLCAKVVSGDSNSPSFGYNGAMQAIVNRLKSALAGQCLPQTLTRGTDGTVPCLILVVYPNQTDQSAGCTDPGMSQPDASVVQRFDQQFIAGLGDAGAGQQPPVVCQFQQLTQGTDYQGASCEGSAAIGWCYVEGAANTGGSCSQAIKFGGSGPPAGTTVDLECIEQSGAADAGTE